MALHMPDITLDYGPPHVFWCFTYERMNGILALTPTNNRGIEQDILNRLSLTSSSVVKLYSRNQLNHKQKHHHSLRLNGHYLCFMLNQKDRNAANSR